MLGEQLGARSMLAGDSDPFDQEEDNLETVGPYKSRGAAVERGTGWTQQAKGKGRWLQGQMFGECKG